VYQGQKLNAVQQQQSDLAWSKDCIIEVQLWDTYPIPGEHSCL
jgi:hypothetical protein